MEASISALAPLLAPELVPLPPLVPTFVPLSRPPQPRAAARAIVETKRAARGIGVNFYWQEQGPVGRSWGARATVAASSRPPGALTVQRGVG
jgi:hypothetical protein